MKASKIAGPPTQGVDAGRGARERKRRRQVPGVVFTDSAGRRAVCIAGTGIEVWEVVRTLGELGGDVEELAEAFHWLGADQLRSALDYYALFTSEVDAEVGENACWTPERIWREFPATRPPWRA